MTVLMNNAASQEENQTMGNNSRCAKILIRKNKEYLIASYFRDKGGVPKMYSSHILSLINVAKRWWYIGQQHKVTKHHVGVTEHAI